MNPYTKKVLFCLLVGLLGLTWAGECLAEGEIGPQHVFKLRGNDPGFLQCPDNACIERKMREGGASPQAMSLAKAMKYEYYLEEFKENGMVDTGLMFPFRPSNHQQSVSVLLNGKPNIILMESYVEQHHKKEIRDALAKLGKKYDMPMTFGETIQSKTSLPDGGVRFVWAGGLVNGPMANPKEIGDYTVAFDFDKNGTFLGTKWLGTKLAKGK
jgi:hypothetical protein